VRGRALSGEDIAVGIDHLADPDSDLECAQALT